jgi:oxygen-independent coproporphyrinogen-3 oxidase
MEDHIDGYVDALIREMELSPLSGAGVEIGTGTGADAGVEIGTCTGTDTGTGADAGVEIVTGTSTGTEIGTVFIGGGTPSFIEARHIARILKKCGQFGLDCDTECTIEANPGTLNSEKLATYIKFGANRLSIGLQSADEKQLWLLGRIHSFEDFKENVAAAKFAGFNNISADLIFGIPGQTVESWATTLAETVKTGVTHISCYSLSVESGTRLYDLIESGAAPRPDDALDRQMYHYAIDYLAKSGFKHYELSNFALPGRECRHNLNYWTCGEYLGFGAGAHSYYNGVRYSNEPSVEGYMKKIKESSGAVLEQLSETLSKAERIKEYAILRLRLTEGIDTDAFRDEFGVGFLKLHGAAVAKLERDGLLSVSPKYAETGRYTIKLTEKGLDLANRVFLEFI